MTDKRFPKKLKITQVRSIIGQRKKARRTVAALGLGRVNRTVLHADTPEIKGMIRVVDHLVRVEEVK
ncbi:MAG: 50S ribosomal protein L30 [Candidatus Neomarinimicrobiota bacterium]